MFCGRSRRRHANANQTFRSFPKIFVLDHPNHISKRSVATFKTFTSFSAQLRGMAAMDYRKMLEEERWAVLQEVAAKRDAEKAAQQAITAQMSSNQLQPNSSSIKSPDNAVLRFSTYHFLPISLSLVGTINLMKYSAECLNEEAEAGLLENVDTQACVQPWRELRGRKLQCLGKFPQQVDVSDNMQLST